MFSESAGKGGRITALQLGLVAGDGSTEWRTVPVDLAFSARGSVMGALPDRLELPDGRRLVQVRVSASGVDSTGQAFSIAPMEVPLAVTSVDTGEMPVPDATFVGAGDIAVCGSQGAELTARLLDRIPGTVFTLGDNVYMTGSDSEFANCYGPTWGRHRARTYPVAGNHDWDTNGGSGYFNYFGAAGGAPTGYYSYKVGAWHVIVLNSNLPAHAGSAQYDWARRDLFANGSYCTAALWHHPVFSSGPNGNSSRMREMWQLLQRSRVDLVLNGHEHGYERFAPQNADGGYDPQGPRSFVVGTGGVALTHTVAIRPNSEMRTTQAWGVLKLTLRARNYNWEFVPADGHTFRDSGTAACLPPD